MADKKVQIEINGKNNLNKGLAEAEGSLQQFAEKAKAVFAPVLAFFTAAAIGNFLKSSVEASAKASAEYAKMGAALTQVGVDATKVGPQVQKTIEDMASRTGMHQADITAAFANLVRRTGDYHTALSLLPRALDVAAARNVELAKASEMVAKAHDGSAKALKMVMNTQGEADAQAQTLSGTLARLGENWEELKVKTGDALTSNQGFADVSNGVVNALKSVADWLDRNSGKIGAFIDFVTGAISDIGRMASALNLFSSGGNNGSKLEAMGMALAAIPATALAGFVELGGAVKLFEAAAIDAFATVLDKVNNLLGIIGVSISSSFINTIRKSAEDARKEGYTQVSAAQEELQKLQDKYNAVLNGKEDAKKTVTTHPKSDEANLEKQQKDKEDKRYNEVIAHLKTELEIASLRVEAQERLNEEAIIERDIANNIKNTDEQRIKAQERLNALKTAGAKLPSDLTNTQLGLPDLAKVNEFKIDPNLKKDIEATVNALQPMVTVWSSINDGINAAVDSTYNLNYAITDLTAGAIQGLADASANFLTNWIEGSKSAGAAFRKALGDAIAGVAAKEAGLSFAKGIQDLATGWSMLGDPLTSWAAPFYFEASAKDFAAGAAFSAVAAGGAMFAGGGGGSGGGGGGGGRNTSYNSASQTNHTASASQGTTTIQIKGRALSTDPLFLEELQKAFANAKGQNIQFEVI